MLTEEAESSVRMSIVAITMSILIFIILSVAYYSYGFFEKETWYESSKLYIKEEADIYKFTVVKNVTGNDITEFILKYDVLYDYLIIEDNGSGSIVGYPIIKGYANQMVESGLDQSKIWSWYTEKYLVNTVFNNNIGEEFLVNPITINGEVTGFEFLLKETNNEAISNPNKAESITKVREKYKNSWNY